MNVLLVGSTDIEGGAARAAYRLHQGLQKIGVASRMLVQNKYSDDPSISAPISNLASNIARSRISLDALPLKLYPQRPDNLLSPQWLPDTLASKVKHLAPQIINLHWINAGYVQIETLSKLKQPLVWTLHDMWAFTGGCHYSQECDRYMQTCGACPQLHSHKNQDLSYWIWQRKLSAWRDVNLTIVALSNWLAHCAASSSLLKDRPIKIIPNGINTEQYRPIDRQFARSLFNLPQDKRLVLFGANSATSDPRKGFHLLKPALQRLSQSTWQDKLELVVFGASKSPEALDFGIKTHYLGTFSDDLSLALIYSAADVFVLPSIQENLANTVMESLACGVPCVAFDIGGMPDMIQHQQNGYLVHPFEIDDLAQGIAWVLDNPERTQRLSYAAREQIEKKFTLEIQAERYKSLFAEILI